VELNLQKDLKMKDDVKIKSIILKVQKID